MKSLRLLVLLMVGGVFAICPAYARAQQEIDPDHFDQPIHKVESQKPMHKGKSSHTQQNRMMASKHGAHRAHHHHSHPAA